MFPERRYRAPTVSLTDEATKLVRNAVTTGSGEYVFTAVEPAAYTLSVTGKRLQEIRADVGEGCRTRVQDD